MPPPNPAWGNPLTKPVSATKAKKAAAEEDPLKVLKKLQPKARISKAGAKAILGEKKGVDAVKALWVEEWLDNFVRQNSFPPQLVSDDFIALLGRFFDPEKAHGILDSLRREFAKRYSWERPTDYDFLETAMRADPKAAPLLAHGAGTILREW